MIFVKIERATGDILKRKEAPSMDRVFNKKAVWIELERKSQPDFNPETHKLVATVEQPDLSDLSTDVDPSTKRVEGWLAVPLDGGEIQGRTNGKISATDHKLARITEDIMVAIATGEPLTRDTFHPKVWEKINKRRQLRGQSDV